MASEISIDTELFTRLIRLSFSTVEAMNRGVRGTPMVGSTVGTALRDLWVVTPNEAVAVLHELIELFRGLGFQHSRDILTGVRSGMGVHDATDELIAAWEAHDPVTLRRF